MLEAARRKELESAIEAEIRDAFEFAERSPFPGREELERQVFKGS